MEIDAKTHISMRFGIKSFLGINPEKFNYRLLFYQTIDAFMHMVCEDVNEFSEYSCGFPDLACYLHY